MLEPPNDIDAICAELGIGLKRRARLAEDKGEALLPYLQKLWKATRERPRLLHRNPGAGKADYTDNLARAMWGEPGGEPEAVNPSEIESYRKSREARDAHQAEQMGEVGDLLAACRELRSAIDAMPKERKQSMSRTLWTLRGRLDQCERELRRRAAA